MADAQREGSSSSDTSSDLIAGWLGGAVGILVSNPLEVLKVRLQTSRSPSAPPPLPSPANRVGRSTPQPNQLSAPRPNLKDMWRAEGMRFIFAGAAGPILGLAFIDSAFFGIYGRLMSGLSQDRQDPGALSRVFIAGATAGGLCAMLETPIEVVKCRAQIESGSGAKLGSFKIANIIRKTDGIKGFYVGGLTTAIHDGISSGIFFWGYFVFRRLLRGEPAFQPVSRTPTIPNSNENALLIPDAASPVAAVKMSENGKLNKAEIGRILLAGGLAGALSAIVPYPFDIIKTRLQTIEEKPKSSTPSAATTTTAAASSAPKATIRSVARGIHADGMASWSYRYKTTSIYNFLSMRIFPPSSAGNKLIDGRPAADPRAEKWSLRLLGLRTFTRGIRPTVVGSFVGSAATITVFEMALHFLGVESSGGVG